MMINITLKKLEECNFKNLDFIRLHEIISFIHFNVQVYVKTAYFLDIYV